MNERDKSENAGAQVIEMNENNKWKWQQRKRNEKWPKVGESRHSSTEEENNSEGKIMENDFGECDEH